MAALRSCDDRSARAGHLHLFNRELAKSPDRVRRGRFVGDLVWKRRFHGSLTATHSLIQIRSRGRTKCRLRSGLPARESRRRARAGLLGTGLFLTIRAKPERDRAQRPRPLRREQFLASRCRLRPRLWTPPAADQKSPTPVIRGAPGRCITTTRRVRATIL